MLFAPGEVVVVVTRSSSRPPAATLSCAPPIHGGVRVSPASVSATSSRGRAASRAAAALALRGFLAPLTVLRPCEEPRRDSVPEAAAAKMNARPDGFRFVHDTSRNDCRCRPFRVVPAPSRQPVARVARHRVPRRAREEGMIDGGSSERFFRPTPNDTTSWISSAMVGSRAISLVFPPVEILRKAALPHAMSGSRPQRPRLLAVRRHATDGHDVAEMSVRHQRRTFGPAGNVLELCQRLGSCWPKTANLLGTAHDSRLRADSEGCESGMTSTRKTWSGQSP